MGKQAVSDSDSDSEDEDANEEVNDKSVALNSESLSDLRKEADDSPGSVAGQSLEGKSSAGISSESGAEEEGPETKGRSSSEGSSSSDSHVSVCQVDGANEPAVETCEEGMVENGSISVSLEAVPSGTETCKADRNLMNPVNSKDQLTKIFLLLKAMVL